jgi:glycosyltransferase involved in cell wall biosynthesis
MTKFLFCLPRYHTNAVPWVRILQAAGHEVAMHCMIGGFTENHSALRPVIHPPSPLSVWLGGHPDNDMRLFPRFRSLYRALHSEDPDVVIVRGITRWFTRMAAIVAIIQGRRVVVYDQEMPHPPLSSTWIRRAMCRLLGIRHFTPKIDFEQQGGIGSAIQIPFGRAFEHPPCSLEHVRPSHWPPKILMVAKFRERKRYADLIGALGIIASQFEFSVTLCGELASEADREFCRNLKDQAVKCGISQRVSFLFNIPHFEMAQVYLDHDLFVLPSANEPAAVSPLEAAWCGCAVIMARSSGTRSYMPPGDKFDFIDGDREDLARALSFLISDQSRLREAQRQCLRAITNCAGDRLILSRLEYLTN